MVFIVIHDVVHNVVFIVVVDPRNLNSFVKIGSVTADILQILFYMGGC